MTEPAAAAAATGMIALPAEQQATDPAQPQAQPPGPLILEHEGQRLEVPPPFIKDGALNPAALLKSWADSQKQIRGQDVPETYAVTLPEGMDLAINDDDPLLSAFRATAKELKLTQPEFDRILGAYLATTNPQQAIAAEKQALKTLYGDRAEGVLTELGAWVGGLVANDQVVPAQHRQAVTNALVGLSASAAGVLVLDLMRQGKFRSAEVGIPGNGAGAGAGAQTEAGLRAMMADPKYWRDRDPAFVKQVQDGFAALYPGQQRAAY